MIQQTSFAEPTMLEALRAAIAKQPKGTQHQRFTYAVLELSETDPRFVMPRWKREDLWQSYRSGAK